MEGGKHLVFLITVTNGSNLPKLVYLNRSNTHVLGPRQEYIPVRNLPQLGTPARNIPGWGARARNRDNLYGKKRRPSWEPVPDWSGVFAWQRLPTHQNPVPGWGIFPQHTPAKNLSQSGTVPARNPSQEPALFA
jgi:hypothetical protein